ncbi:MAG TPA: DUF5606 domain-containing protein [Bacteroidales bacterium]|nr:DUF5606 domain-containing protein [Bacteroidales bacterium]
MLKKIVAVSGKPGLYKMLSQGKNMLIIESLVDGKRMPAYNKDKVMSLGEISMYTENGEKPLHEVLELLKTKAGGEKLSIDPKASNDELRAYFADVLPDYDRERVYPSDIRKLLNWYNLLIEKGYTNFAPVKEEEKEKEKEEPATDTPEQKAKK